MHTAYIYNMLMPRRGTARFKYASNIYESDSRFIVAHAVYTYYTIKLFIFVVAA